MIFNAYFQNYCNFDFSKRFYFEINLFLLREVNEMIRICIAILALFQIVWAQTDTINAEKSKARLEKQIMSRSYDDRFNAVNDILSFPDLDTTWAVNTLINGLRYELTNPSGFSPNYGYGIFKFGKHKRSYANALIRLGPSIAPMLQARLDSLSGESKDWITIVL
jgi:hypothetical protein